MEIVDVIDENNTVLYQTSKDETHQKGLLHRVICAEFINSKGEFILVKQAYDKQDAGQYVSAVGGHVQAGESDIDALKREVEEEIGLKNFEYKLRGESIFDRHILGRHENHYFVFFEIYSDELPILGHESVAYKHFQVKDLKKHLKIKPYIFGDAFHFVVKHFYPQFIK